MIHGVKFSANNVVVLWGNGVAYTSQAIRESIAMQYTRPLLKNADIMHVGLNIQLNRDKTLSELN